MDVPDYKKLSVLLATAAALGAPVSLPSIKVKYTNAQLYSPCPCGSGKKFKFCCKDKKWQQPAE